MTTVAQRTFLIGTGIWLALQLSRLIAWVLIQNIDAVGSYEAWRYPAYLDLFAVVGAVPLIWAVWARRGLLTWVALVVYWAISIVTTSAISSPPPLSGRRPLPKV